MIEPKLNFINHRMVPDKILFLFVAIRNPRWLPSQDKYNIGSYRTIIQNYSNLKLMNHCDLYDPFQNMWFLCIRNPGRPPTQDKYYIGPYGENISILFQSETNEPPQGSFNIRAFGKMKKNCIF